MHISPLDVRRFSQYMYIIRELKVLKRNGEIVHQPSP